MIYVVVFLLGIAIGVGATYALLLEARARVAANARDLEIRRGELSEERANHERQHADLQKSQREAERAEANLRERQEAFDRRIVTYTELQNENRILKRDLHNIDLDLRRFELAQQRQKESQEAIDSKVRSLGDRYLSENVKWISSSITPNNFVASKQRLNGVIERVRDIGFVVSDSDEKSLHRDLRAEFEKAVRAAAEREEQIRIRAQIREEMRLEKERERELAQLEREREAIATALKKALEDAQDAHGEEVERLKARLAEAEAKSQRAVAQAQLTKAGYVYVISNIGSFGDGVFKIGMTRRLEPMERVKELGDASVPFPFDVHMMISSDNAPALENALHRALHQARLNRVNPRKEFFRADFDLIRSIVSENHGAVEYQADAEALEYRQSISMTEDEAEFVESVFEQATADDEPDFDQ